MAEALVSHPYRTHLADSERAFGDAGVDLVGVVKIREFIFAEIVLDAGSRGIDCLICGVHFRPGFQPGDGIVACPEFDGVAVERQQLTDKMVQRIAVESVHRNVGQRRRRRFA